VVAFSAIIFPAQATPKGADGEHKVWVCHATASEKNPYVLIHIDEAGWLNGHQHHRGDDLLEVGEPLEVKSCEDGSGGGGVG
jgi:hypothetical protein